jgi:lipopolysaccharide biosynthesis regulator YciM
MTVAHVLQFFSYMHLPVHLQEISRPYAELAEKVAATSNNDETVVALRKLLESKDAAVRAKLISSKTT